ncbi:MAG: VTT domain-containing protein [archaeon]
MLYFMIDMIDLVLNIDLYVGLLIDSLGLWSYVALFAVIFCETGLVFLPFLPGDSLLFLVGAFAGTGSLNVLLLLLILSIAAVLGDSVNYAVGRYFGEKVFLKKGLLKRKHLDKAKSFYTKYGAKAIVIARFVPVIRTIAPFVAGMAEMEYSKFLMYNIIGGVVWVSGFLFAGYFFGSIPFVKENLTLILAAVIIISLVPMVIEGIKYKIKK